MRTRDEPAGPTKAQAPTVASTETAAASIPAVKPIAREERKAIPVKPAPESTSAAKSESKKTYVVAKGDNPVSIARKFKISSDDLLAANKIEDAHKLKIGQKLIIPTKATTTKDRATKKYPAKPEALAGAGACSTYGQEFCPRVAAAPEKLNASARALFFVHRCFRHAGIALSCFPARALCEGQPW